jgi:hypothetical protein
MGKGLLIGKRVISIQFTKNNTLQGAVLNALIHFIVLSTINNNSSNDKKKIERNKKE